jgi:O-acetylserine/cysteine efflux transporter
MKPQHRTLAVLVTIIWGVNFVVIDEGLRDVPPLLLTALRFLACAPLALLVPRPTSKLRFVIGYGVMLGVIKFGLLFTAMAHGMPAGLASLVLQLQALFSLALAALLLGERPTRAQAAGAGVATAGMALLATDGTGGSVAIGGLIMTVGAAAAWGLANVLIRASGETRPLSMLAWSSLVPPLPLVGLSAIVDGPHDVVHSISHLTLRAFLAIGYVAYISTLIGFGLWNRLIGLYSVSKVAPFSLLVPIFGLTAAWIALDEPLTWRLAGCTVLVLAGLAMVVRKRSSIVAARGEPDPALTSVLDRAGDPVGDGRAELALDQMQPEIEAGGEAARGDAVAVVDDPLGDHVEDARV